MTPVYDWTRFDVLREQFRSDYARMRAEDPAIGNIRGKLADAREALERGQAVRMSEPGIPGERPEGWRWVKTPDEFCDLWEQGYRP